jgi:hypothetical protein
MGDRKIVIVKHVPKLGARESTEFCRRHSHHRNTTAEALANSRKIAVPAEPLAEAACPRHAVFD